MPPDTVRLLLVEDNPADVFLMEAALEMSTARVRLDVARDGREALDLLQAVKAGPFPDLILLDLNMPRMNGFEFLTALRGDPHLVHLPVVMFSTSNAPADIKQAYALQTNSYVSKPSTLDGFLRLVTLLEAYWFGAASLPRSYSP